MDTVHTTVPIPRKGRRGETLKRKMPKDLESLGTLIFVFPKCLSFRSLLLGLVRVS